MKHFFTLSTAVLCCFLQNAAAQSYFDFEDGKRPPSFSFSRGSEWRITSPGLDGRYALSDSVVPNRSVSESFSFAAPYSEQASADTFRALVRFVYSNTSGAPVATTSTNRFGLFVGANVGADDSLSFTFTNEKLKAFVLSFRGTSGDDTLRLFYQQNKTQTTVLSTKVRCNNALLAVQLVCPQQGVLTLSVGLNGSFANMQTYTSDSVKQRFAGPHVGAHLVTNNTNRKWLQLDNLYATFRPLNVLQRGDVVINEVLFNPNAGGVDFVELYNRSDGAVDLQGVCIANRTLSTGALYRSYELPSYVLPPNGYVVVTTNPEVVWNQYYCEDTSAFITLSTMPTYPNDAGCVTLLNVDGTLLEDFYYTEKMHSGVLANKKGVSLERINPDRPASESSNWQSAAQVAGFATPTYKNSQHSDHAFGGDDGISLYPEVFSPDGDGVDDVLFIGYKMPSEGYVANITVFTSAGRMVKALCRNATLAVEGQLSWDGVCDSGKLAEVGVYIVYAEVFSLNGKVSRYKKTCVVGARF